MTLPVAGRREPCKVRRDDIGDYWPEPFPEGEGTRVKRRYIDSMFTVKLPLAEFEALLFGAAPAEDDAYTRAAVRFAEAWANEHVDADEYGKARIAFLALHCERGKHGG